MAESFVTQGVNVICSNMQIPGPNKLGLDPDRANAITNTVYNNKNADHFLTISDKKLEKPFECKVTGKFWGGLTRLCAGIVIGLAVLGAAAVIIGTGGAAGVIFAALLTTAKIGAGIAAGIGAISVGVHAWKSRHDCDVSLESPNWQFGHNSVKLQGEYALLSGSTMTCAKGGVLQLVESDINAQIAGNLISSNNKNEVKVHYTSQLWVGVVGGLTGGGTAVGSVLTIGLYAYREDRESDHQAIVTGIKEDNENDITNKEFKESVEDFGIETGADIIQSGGEHGISQIQAWGYKNIAVYRLLSGASETSFEGAAIAARMAKDAPKHIWTNFGIGLGAGAAGAVASYFIEKNANSKESAFEDDVIDAMYDRAYNTDDDSEKGISKNASNVYKID